MHVRVFCPKRPSFCRRFMQQNIERRLRNPIRILACNSIIGRVFRQPSLRLVRKVYAHVVSIAAPDCIPVGRLELKPVRQTRSDVLPLIRGASKNFRSLEILKKRTRFSRQITSSVEGSGVPAADCILIILDSILGIMGRQFRYVAPGKLLGVIVNVGHESDVYLPQVAQTLCNFCLLFRPTQSGQ